MTGSIQVENEIASAPESVKNWRRNVTRERDSVFCHAVARVNIRSTQVWKAGHKHNGKKMTLLVLGDLFYDLKNFLRWL